VIFCSDNGRKLSATTPKRIFEKIYPYYSFVVGLLFLFIFDFFVLKNERGELKG